MADLDTRPETVNIAAYAGDTLTINVTVPTDLVAGREWTAQVRGNRETGVIDATFTVVPTGTGAVLTLSEAVTRALAEGGVLARTATRAAVLRYSGEWDVQLAPAGGGDPVTTLVQGALTIDLDVTRAEP